MKLLVSTDWLAQRLGEVAVLDASAHLPAAARDPYSEFVTAHVPGARFLDLPSLTDDASPVPAALPRADQFERRLRDLGIAEDSPIVLYDNSMLRSAARANFMFRMFGFEDVALLDGGFEKWQAEGRPLESGPSEWERSTIAIAQEDRSRIRSKADMLANCESRAAQVVDARDAARFTGESDDAVHGLEGGHIPGARHLFFRSLLAEDGTFKPGAELRSLFDEAGIDLDAPLIASCGSGMTASVVLFAAELLNKRDAALYDGSWSEWGADPDTPKETGRAH